MALVEQLPRLADRVVQLVKDEAGLEAIVWDEAGDVVSASHPLLRERPLSEIRSCPILVGGRTAAVIGILGEAEQTRPVVRLAALLLASWCEEIQADDPSTRTRREDERRARVLAVHASPALLEKVRDALGDGYDVLSATTVSEARSMASREGPDVVLCEEAADLFAPLLSAMKFEADLSGIPFIVVSERAGEEGESFLEAGADDALPAAASRSELRMRVRAAVRYRRMYPQLHSERRALVRANRSLSRTQARTRAVIESALDGILLLDPRGRIESLNGTAERMLSCAPHEVSGKPFVEHFVSPASRRGLADLLAERARGAEGGVQAAGYEVIGRAADGREFPMDCRARRIETGAGAALCVFIRDLTETRRLQMELHQAQKLEAVGRLAAGIAHEINTPIQYIGDNTRFLGDAFEAMQEALTACHDAIRPDARAALEDAEEESELEYFREQVPKTVESTLRGVERVASIVRGMKEFAHPDRIEMTATDINRGVLATIEVARNEYKYVARVETDLEESLPFVVCHAGDVNQVILNLVVNAAHAIADAVKGTALQGTIRISTRLEGGVVAIAVADTGTGIPEAVRDKVFDPFFTTKEVGRGTGQGLAIARTIVQKHGGTITLETETGKGTTFFIRLPVQGQERARAVA